LRVRPLWSPGFVGCCCERAGQSPGRRGRPQRRAAVPVV